MAEPGSLGARLRQAREAAGLDQYELAALSSLRQSTISQIETGERKEPSAVTVSKLEMALRLRTSALMTPAAGDYITVALERFLATPLGQSLGLTKEEERAIAAVPWFSEGREPTTRAWYDFISAWLATAGRKGG